jgi:hypothetical protein
MLCGFGRTPSRLTDHPSHVTASSGI